MSKQEREELIGILESQAMSYVAEVKKVSWLTFKGKNLPAKNVASLTEAINDVKMLMESFLSQLQFLRRHPFSTKHWVILLREYFHPVYQIQMTMGSGFTLISTSEAQMLRFTRSLS